MFPVRSWVVFALGLYCLAAPVMAQTTVYVDDDACPGGGSGSSSDPFCSIQEAICAIQGTGGTVYVLPGTYNESLRMLGGVSVISTDGPSVTTLDATGKPCIRSSDCQPSTVNLTCSAVVFGSYSLPTDRLEGFRITGGSGLFRDYGGGTPPNAVAGGGVFVFNSSPVITGNEIVTNVLAHPSTDYFWGGGVYVYGSDPANPNQVQITDNLIEGNVANSPAGGNKNSLTESVGGGLYFSFYAAPTVDNNSIRLNQAGDTAVQNQMGWGGGMSIYGISPIAEPVVTRNLLQGNNARDYAGAINLGEIYDTYVYPSRGLFENNIIDQNASGFSAGGVLSQTTRAVFRNNTIVDNTAEFGGGMTIGQSANPGDQLTLVNNLIVFNTETMYGGGGIAVYGSDPVVRYNDLFGNLSENVGSEKQDSDYIGIDGNVSVDPLFVDFNLSTRDLHLQPGSPVIDAGDNAESPLEDYEGNARPQDGDGDGQAVVDMGAYELPDPGFGDSDGDGVLDDGDASGSTTNNPCAPGETVGCDDSCTFVPNPGQEDADGDGFGDACDCRPNDPTLWDVPPEVPDLAVSDPLKTRLDWSSLGSNVVYDLISGTLSDLQASGLPDDATCLVEDLAGTTWTDVQPAPVPGEALYYLLRGENLCGAGTYGQATAGAERLAPLACP